MKNKKSTMHLDILTLPICARVGCGRKMESTHARKQYCSQSCKMQVYRGAKKKDFSKTCKFCMAPGLTICKPCRSLAERLKLPITRLTPRAVYDNDGILFREGILPVFHDRHGELLSEHDCLSAINVWLWSTARYLRALYLIEKDQEAPTTDPTDPT